MIKSKSEKVEIYKFPRKFKIQVFDFWFDEKIWIKNGHNAEICENARFLISGLMSKSESEIVEMQRFLRKWTFFYFWLDEHIWIRDGQNAEISEKFGTPTLTFIN